MIEFIDPDKAEFDIMCFVKDSRISSGKCTYDMAAAKFEGLEIRKLIDGGVLTHSNYGMLDWSYLGTRLMAPHSLTRHIKKQIARERGV